jgi:uncharacterized RDD family membrane protein YckC
VTPAGLPRRYAAWSLDAALLALAATALCQRRIGDGLERSREALAALAEAMAALMLEALRHDAQPLALLLAWLTDPALHGAAGVLAAAMVATVWPPLLAFALLGLAYHAGFEASSWQATPGKRALGLRVVAGNGSRPGLPRAALRQAAGLLSWLSLNLGHLLAALPPRHRALHDAVAGARVVQDDAAATLPGWARAWLAVQVVAAMAAVACLFAITDAALRAAFDRVL